MPKSTALKPAVFLDRDGVVIEDRNYAYRIDDLHVCHGVVEAIRLLVAKGFVPVVVTNQTGVARGFFTIADLEKFNLHLQQTLAKAGVALDHIYYCPHLADGKVAEYSFECDCRKPKPGMLLRAASELGLDLEKSFMIGDKLSDVQAGQAAGCHSILIAKESSGTTGINSAKDLLDAVRRYVVV